MAERELVNRLRNREEAALTELAALYAPKIQPLAFRYLRNWEDAEEVAQDVLWKVWRKIGDFRGEAALSSWIYRITFTTAMSRLREDRTRRMAEVPPLEIPLNAEEDITAEPVDWSAFADDKVLRDQMWVQLSAAMTRLPRNFRATVLLRDVCGLSVDETSAILRVKPQTLKSRLHRGRRALRKRLHHFAGGVELHNRERLN